MGLFDKSKLSGALDKAKNAASSAANAAKSAVETAKENIDEKKAERAAHEAEMKEKAAALSEQIVTSVKANGAEGSLFGNVDSAQLISFTKDFYERLLLPAMSVTYSKILMYPHIDDKAMQKAFKIIGEIDSSETPLILIKTADKNMILITEKSLYFAISLPEDAAYRATGRIDNSDIGVLTFTVNGETAVISCDGYAITQFPANKSTNEDFLSLTNYFTCIKNEDFEITDEEVHTLISEKIGANIVSVLKKYMIDDDERFVYFAWGLDSLSAKDYIVCTNRQIIVLDREMFGATGNVKQFYYEDITSASVEQNSKSNDLTGYLIDTAITAATNTCDLFFSVAGARNKIKTLYKPEAERVVAVYHQFRNSIKKAASEPKVVVQQAQAADPLEQLKKLSSLKEAGIISEAEFEQKKTELLGKI